MPRRDIFSIITLVARPKLFGFSTVATPKMLGSGMVIV